MENWMNESTANEGIDNEELHEEDIHWYVSYLIVGQVVGKATDKYLVRGIFDDRRNNA